MKKMKLRQPLRISQSPRLPRRRVQNRIELGGKVEQGEVTHKPEALAEWVSGLHIRALAYRWIRIIYRCWKERIPYSEETYHQALLRRQSPLVKALVAQVHK